MKKPPIKVVSHDEAERCSYVVCMRKGSYSPFTDNETGVCSHCGTAIFFRPYMAKTPPKICLECISDLMMGGHA